MDGRVIKGIALESIAKHRDIPLAKLRDVIADAVANGLAEFVMRELRQRILEHAQAEIIPEVDSACATWARWSQVLAGSQAE